MLQVKGEAVFFALGGKVHGDAQLGEGAVAVAQQLGFGGCNDGGPGGCGGGKIEVLHAGEPVDNVQIAQAADAVFDVRFQRLAGLLGVALLHFQQFAFNERDDFALLPGGADGLSGEGGVAA